MNDEMSHVLTRQETSHDWSYRQLGQNLITPTALWLVGDCRKVSYWPGLQPIRSQTHVNLLSISTAFRLIDPESLYVVVLRHKLLGVFNYLLCLNNIGTILEKHCRNLATYIFVNFLMKFLPSKISAFQNGANFYRSPYGSGYRAVFVRPPEEKWHLLNCAFAYLCWLLIDFEDQTGPNSNPV